jgi:uncharacterized membrane protein YhfC
LIAFAEVDSELQAGRLAVARVVTRFVASPAAVYTLGGLAFPSITMVALHFRQRIFASRSETFSSAIEYLAAHAGQEIFTIGLASGALE